MVNRMRAENSLRYKLSQLPWAAIGLMLALLAGGLMMQYSAAGGSYSPYASAQVMRAVPGVLLMVMLALMPFRWLLSLSYVGYILCILLLIYVEVAGSTGMGATRWISVGGMTIQPSEFTKLGLIVMLARYFHYTHPEDVSGFLRLGVALLLIAIPVALILKQPNLGTATILSFIAVTILFIAGIRWYYFAAAITILLVSAPIGWQFLHDYQKQRVMTFLDPAQDPLGAGYNIMQSIIAVGSGGFWGKGLVQGSQGQLNFLPEKQTDFIFTMVAEELGFVGAFLLIASYAALLLFSMALIVRSKNRFGSYIAAGVTAMLFAHVLINIGMVMGLFPVVGVPLPFMSYGGSFLISILAAMGLLINVYANRDNAL